MPSSKRVKMLRDRARKKHLDKLILIHNSKCCKCGVNVVRVKNIEKEYKDVKVYKGQGYVLYRNSPDEQYQKSSYATVQHLSHPLNKNANNIENLLLYCYNCNHRDACGNSTPKQTKLRKCKFCGKERLVTGKRGRKSCNTCRKKNSNDYLFNQSLTSSCL